MKLPTIKTLGRMKLPTIKTLCKKKLRTIKYLPDPTNYNIRPPDREKFQAIENGESNSHATISGSPSSTRTDSCNHYVPEDEQSAISALQKLDNPFDAFHPTLTDSEIIYNGPGTCLLFTLPRELRDMIYIYLVAAGHVKLAQVSRRCAREVMDVVGKWGICRFRLDKGDRPLLPRQYKTLGRTLQYLDIFIDGDATYRDPMAELQPLMIKYFGDAIFPRKSCRVVVKLSSLYQYHYLYRDSKVSSVLVGFQYLTIELSGLKDSSRRSVEQGIDECKKLGDRLRESLGDYALKRNDQGSTYLELQPRAYLEECTRRKQLAVQEGNIISRG